MLRLQWQRLYRQATCCTKYQCLSREASAFSPFRGAPEREKVPSTTLASNRAFSSEVSLPKLRPPPLKHSVDLYLEYTKPLVPLEQWQKTAEIAKKFLRPGGEGEQLQRRLQMRAEEHENWLSEFWLDSYLDRRDSLPVFSNPAFWLPPRCFDTDDVWLAYAACMVSGALKYKVLLDRRQLPVDKSFDGSSLCMAQNYTFFGNFRQPGFMKDRLRYRYGKEACRLPSRYICVLIKNHFYLVQVLDDSTNEPLPTHLIFRQLRSAVLSASDTGIPVGLFTTLPRDDWLTVYGELCSDPTNESTLASIENSLFLLCLDTSSGISQLSTPVSADTHISFYDSAIANNSLHGVSSSAYNAGNRWFDKSQFIVARDGVVGLNFEHSPFDGHVGVAVLEAALAETPTAEVVIQQEAGAATSMNFHFCVPRLLDWSISPNLCEKLEIARDLFDTVALDTDIACGKFTAFSKSLIKSAGLSPDAFIQIGIQLAYARLHPNRPPPATYESGTLRRFRLGRTEAIRSCSAHSVAFTKAMANDTISTSEKCALLRKAIEQHQLYTKMAATGHGFDRHLLGLRLIAADSGDPTPSIFADPTYETANHFSLTTSQITGKQDFGASFDPLIPDGYGFTYNLQGHYMNLTASTFKSKTSDNAAVNLINAFAASLLDMRKLLEGSVEVDINEK